MLGLLKIYFLLNFYFILTKCDPSYSTDDLTVRKLDKKLIERKRQDTRDMCKKFNLEAMRASFPPEDLPYNKYDKRKKELKLKEQTEDLQKINTHRVKRAVNSVNPALNVEDELRVETIVDKIYDDLQEKGQKIAYRRKEIPKAEVKSNSSAANKTARRFPFAPLWIDVPSTTTKRPQVYDYDEKTLDELVRFDHAIVPYFIDSRTYDTHLSNTITKAFDYFEKETCIRLQRLRERPTDQKSLQNVKWLYITNPSGIRQCVHSNEKAEIKGVQMIVFGYDCMSVGDISHEIMHVLGFSHEHVRPDRNQHITVLWDNIKPGYRKYFEVHNTVIFESLPYDYASVMHYPQRAFSNNGRPTILTEPGIKIGQRDGLSEIDKEKISILYSNECHKRDQEFLLKTCPSAVKSDMAPKQVTKQEIDDYFKDRLWPYGVVNYKLKDLLEFSSEEIENINAVLRHIEKETCVEFRNLTSSTNAERQPDDSSSTDNQFNSDELERLVILTISGENVTKAILPDTSTSSEEDTQNLMMNNLIIDPVKTFRKSAKGKNISVEGKAANIDVKGKDANFGPKGNDANLRAKVKDANIDAKRTDANIDANGRTVNDTSVQKPCQGCGLFKQDIAALARGQLKEHRRFHVSTGKQSDHRRKRVVPPSPSRRHASSILVLSRSPQPGCHCPQPGKPYGSYELKINTDCFNSVNDLLHLFVHVLGLDHQHNMHDRDSYLHIVWDELTEDLKKEMNRKLPPAASAGFQYDYQSVMHYPWLQIKNGKTNIMYPIWNDGWAMGHWQGLSSTDIEKISLLYIDQCLQRKQQAEKTQKDTGKTTSSQTTTKSSLRLL